MRRPARNLAISSKNEIEMSKKNVKRGRNRVRVHAARHAVVGVLDRGGEREGHRLGRRRAGLLHVLADDRHRVPLRHVRGCRSRCGRRGCAARRAARCGRTCGWRRSARGSRSGSTCRVIASQATPRRFAVASRNASSVNGDGSFIAQRCRARSTPARRVSMCSTVLTTDAAGAEQLGVRPRPCRSRGTPSCTGSATPRSRRAR